MAVKLVRSLKGGFADRRKLGSGFAQIAVKFVEVGDSQKVVLGSGLIGLRAIGSMINDCVALKADFSINRPPFATFELILRKLLAAAPKRNLLDSSRPSPTQRHTRFDPAG